MRVELCIGDMTSSTGMGLLPAGQGDTPAPGPQPVSEVATGLLQFARLFTASTAGTFNVSQASGWTASADVCSWEFVSCNDDRFGPGIYLDLSSERITGGNDCLVQVARLTFVPMSSA